MLWRSGDASDCKSDNAGSIPASISNEEEIIIIANRLEGFLRWIGDKDGYQIADIPDKLRSIAVAQLTK